MDIEITKFPVKITRSRPSVSNEVYRKYIASILKQSTNIDHTNIDRWTSERFASDWEKSRTHPSASIENSYETTEFYGDKLANSIASLYIKQTYPEIINTEWLTKIQNYMHSRRGFMQVSYYMELYKYVITSDEGWEQITMVPPRYEKYGGGAVWHNPNWKKMLTDLFEAFIGNLFNVVHKDQGFVGVAYEVIHQVGPYYFQYIKLKLDILFLVDPVTLLKESMDMKRTSLGIPVQSLIPLYKFTKHMTQETIQRMSQSGIEYTEFRYVLTFPDPKYEIQDSKKTDLKYMQLIKVVVGDWFPDDQSAKLDAAVHGLRVWKEWNYPTKQKLNFDQKNSWKPDK